LVLQPAAGMDPLVSAVQRECGEIKTKTVAFGQELTTGVTMIMDQAKLIGEIRGQLGDAAAEALAAKCRANLESLLRLQNEQSAQIETLGQLPSELDAQVSPRDVKSRFEQGVASRVEQQQGRSFDGTPEMRKYEALVNPSAAGPAGDEDEDIVMTQETIMNFKCPITQADMTPSGPMRPVQSTSCPGRCVFSFQGITDHINRQGKSRGKGPASCKCPNAGCSNQSLQLKDLVDSKETVRALKRAREE